ncbi:DUF4093 domain-containing protein, partial [Patescibacteria group bacterium]|nr:DUF4093 domain-containing protein [Patescibacteria group bacterium]
MIRELIVVEGKNDAHAVRQALGEVDILWTNGYGLTKKTLEYIAEMANRQGVIVFTDPDTVGEQIRNRIRAYVPQAKHTYLTRKVATKDGDIGVENAAPHEIRSAFAHIQQDQISNMHLEFTIQELLLAGLSGTESASEYRIAVGRKLGKNDAHAVRQALGEVDILWTNGYGLTKKTLEYIAEMAN